MLMKRLLAFFAIATFGITTLSAENVETVYSPDGKVKLSFSLSEEGRPQYSVDCGELPAVLTSGMGFELVGKSDDLKSHLDRDFEITGTSRGDCDETWSPVWGEETSIRNHYNEFVVNLMQRQTGRRMDIRFRVYDDGVGFRYEFPQQQSLVYFVLKYILYSRKSARSSPCREISQRGGFRATIIPRNMTTRAAASPRSGK